MSTINRKIKREMDLHTNKYKRRMQIKKKFTSNKMLHCINVLLSNNKRVGSYHTLHNVFLGVNIFFSFFFLSKVKNELVITAHF